MADLRADFRLGLGMDEIDQALPSHLMLWSIETRTPWRDAAFRADAGHLDIRKAGAALGPLGIVGKMPVGRTAVDGLVLRHRRDDDAVLQRHFAQPKRREHRSPAQTVAAGAGL